MAKKFLILVEGIADLVFIRDLLLFIDPLLKKEEEEKNSDKSNKCERINPLILRNEKREIRILQVSGYSRIKNLKNNILPYKEGGYKIIVIFDADSAKTNGGYNNRKNEIEKVLNEQLEILNNYSIFLLPNNRDDGDLETLLLNIANQNFYKPFEKYLVVYSENIKNLKQEANLTQDTFHKEILSRKNKVYNYIQVFLGKNKASERYRNYLNEKLKLWIFEDRELEPLINFLKKELQ